MEEEDGARSLIWRSGQDGVVAVRMETADDAGAGRFVDPQALAAKSNAAVGLDADCRALTPDVRPPRTAWSGAQDGTFFPPRQLPGSLWSGADLPVFFLRVVVMA